MRLAFDMCCTPVLITAGLGGSAAITLVYPFFERQKVMLLSLVAILGLCNSIAFSTAYQLVTLFPTSNSVALTTGMPFAAWWLSSCPQCPSALRSPSA